MSKVTPPSLNMNEAMEKALEERLKQLFDSHASAIAKQITERLKIDFSVDTGKHGIVVKSTTTLKGTK